jgi:hypothetical protein
MTVRLMDAELVLVLDVSELPDIDGIRPRRIILAFEATTREWSRATIEGLRVLKDGRVGRIAGYAYVHSGWRPEDKPAWLVELAATALTMIKEDGS